MNRVELDERREVDLRWKVISLTAKMWRTWRQSSAGGGKDEERKEEKMGAARIARRIIGSDSLLSAFLPAILG